MASRPPRIVHGVGQPKETLTDRIAKFVKTTVHHAPTSEPVTPKAKPSFGKGPSNEEKAARRDRNIVFLRGGR